MRLLSIIIAQLSLLAFLLVSVHPAQAQSQSTPATKDSTIMRSTVSCPDCPNRNCYECTLGHNNTLVANTGGLAYIRALIGFTLPYDGSLVRSCQIQIPAFTQPLQSDITVVFWQAVSSNWDESTVTANNAPDAGGQVATVTVPANNNMGPVDITGACRNATSGQFSVYIGTQFGRIEFWSKDSGNPAILHVDRFVKKTPS
ncbi:hypothetical protein DL89DRAFT_36474 [Linderina pennispora]|uniref:Carbohydrate-binding module family 96 domain-containing protein n=1 Tax=Linderina pennispora TaxID=61395 RepID=A0A1Y1W2S1_9FUNG|nr:uncharacterized protein DL89DRAFT_36474 [Linderina pennispora]ORX67788.1 hypothetical protein DL89DRAFT_36474 [Linderina pennispora]